MTALQTFVEFTDIEALIEAWFREDMGSRGDISSQLLIPAEATTSASFTVREAGVVCGLAILPYLVSRYDPSLELSVMSKDGDFVEAGSILAVVSGNHRNILAMERPALNLLGRLCGVATQTRKYADIVKHTSAKVCDTRKTTPGLRGFEKYAVACGGGLSHRLGLYDAVLIKDNHIANIPIESLSGEINELCRKAQQLDPAPEFVQVEVDTLEQLDEVLKTPVDIILLDNMPPETMKEAVARRDAIADQIRLEASGGVTMDTLRDIAESGVDRISVGALTHSVKATDIGLDIG